MESSLELRFSWRLESFSGLLALLSELFGLVVGGTLQRRLVLSGQELFALVDLY